MEANLTQSVLLRKEFNGFFSLATETDWRFNWTMLYSSSAGIRALLFVAFFVVASCAVVAQTSSLSDSEVDAFNVSLGTQTFSPRYKFTSQTKLVETAEAMHTMGSGITKFAMGRLFGSQYGITLPGAINSLTTLARNEPSCRHVLDMDFQHYFLWTYTFASNGDDAWWKNGYSESERIAEYNEIYAFSQYLLTNYSHSGKSFYLGHWEGDWYLISPSNTEVNPSATAIQGMIAWLNNRQKAVDDAMRDTPHTNVFLYHYTEVNRVRDAMLNPPTSNQRLVNTVLPAVTNIDYVSWSAYDGMHLDQANLHATLDYIEANISTNKASRIPGKRAFIGEYGWGGTLSSPAQEPLTRDFIAKTLGWGAPFILFWQMYDNEGLQYWLIDSANNKTPCYDLHQRFLNQARLRVARFKELYGRLPSHPEFVSLATPLLAQSLPALSPLVLSHQSLLELTTTSAVVNATVEQGIYGDHKAAVRLFWGTNDGATNSSNWEHSTIIGLNTNFNPTEFAAEIANLLPQTKYFYRFHLSNETAQVWAPFSSHFLTDTLNPTDFGARLKITFAGYNRSEPQFDIPMMVRFNNAIPGFTYKQFISASGHDLRFTDATGTQVIPHEIDEWNPQGTSVVWVRVPQLSRSIDHVWAYWGNPSATNPPSYATNGTVWTNGFELVWHMKNAVDSARKHSPTSTSFPAFIQTGVIGTAGLFNGSSSFLSAGPVSLGDQFTLSAWIKIDPSVNNIQTIWSSKGTGSNPSGIALFANSFASKDQKLILESGNGSAASYADTPTNLVTLGQWKHVAAVIDRGNGKARMYIDGVERTVGGDVRTDFNNASALLLGCFTNTPVNTSYPFRGTIDEVRVEKTLRSSDWLWAAFMNVQSNAQFQTYGPVALQAPSAVAQISANTLEIRWPGYASSFALWTTTNVGAPSSWTIVTNNPSLQNNDWKVLLPVALNTNRFFQLRAP